MLFKEFCCCFDCSADVSKREMEAVSQMREAVQMVEAASLEKEQVVVNSWAWARQNQQNDMCTQWRHRSAWASAQSDQSLRCPHEESLGP